VPGVMGCAGLVRVRVMFVVVFMNTRWNKRGDHSIRKSAAK